MVPYNGEPWESNVFLITWCCGQISQKDQAEYLPVHHPSEEEKLDTMMFAKNVQLMAQELNIPISDLSGFKLFRSTGLDENNWAWYWNCSGWDCSGFHIFEWMSENFILYAIWLACDDMITMTSLNSTHLFLLGWYLGFILLTCERHMLNKQLYWLQNLYILF